MSEAAMPHTRSDESDIAYLKRMADAGRGQPAPFLLLMAVFGGAYGLSFLTIGTSVHVLGAEAFQTAQPTPWIRMVASTPLVSHALFVLALLWTGWRTLGPDRVKLSRAALAIWSAAFVAFITIVTAFHLYTLAEPPTDRVYTAYMLPPVLLTVWGCAWWVTAILSERRWLLTVAAGSFIAAVTMAVIGNAPPIVLTSGACLLLLAFVPAVILMRGRRV